MLLPEPVYGFRPALEALETVMRNPLTDGGIVRARTIRVSERITNDDHSFMLALHPVAHEYGWTARVGRYDKAERFSVVTVFNTR